MYNLRIIGLIIGLFGLFLTFKIYRGPRWRRLNFILFGIFSLSLIAVSLNPNLLNSTAGILALQKEYRGRILALLIGSNILLWFLLLYFKMRFDEYKYQFDLLVRNLGYEEVKHILKNNKVTDKQIMVVIPAYNEEDNLRELLKKIPSEIENKKVGVLIVDDGSSDNTGEVARQMGYLCVRNKVKRGGGAALRAGYDVLRDIKPEICVTMDADGQHNPEEIKRLVRPILENRYDFVIGSRVLGAREKDNPVRFLGLKLFSFVISLLLGKKITDCSSGFRAFKVSLLQSITLLEDQYHTSELLIDSIKKGFRVGEVPITISKRKYGTSKKGKDLFYGLNFAKTIIKTWWR